MPQAHRGASASVIIIICFACFRCSRCLSTTADADAKPADEKQADDAAKKEDKAGEEMAAQIKKLQEEIKEGKV